MHKIVVAGAHSGIGKTLYAEQLLKTLPGWSAVKVTTRKRAGCPRGAKHCGVCGDIKRDFEITYDKKTICQRGTDTARLKKAGARKVIWLKATEKGLKAGLRQVFKILKGADGVVIEGTSVIKHIKPGILIFLKGNSRAMRPIARTALKKADIVI